MQIKKTATRKRSVSFKVFILSRYLNFKWCPQYGDYLV